MTNSGFEFLVDKAVRCFFVKHYGVFDREIALKGNQTVLLHQDYQWDLNRVIDVRNCKIDLSSDDIRDLSRTITRRAVDDGQYRGAYLVDSSLAYGLARVFNSFADNATGDYKIFKADEKDVGTVLREWLQLEDTYALPEFMPLT